MLDMDYYLMMTALACLFTGGIIGFVVGLPVGANKNTQILAEYAKVKADMVALRSNLVAIETKIKTAVTKKKK